MNSKVKPHSDYVWFQRSEYDNNVYIHLTYEHKKYVRYFYDDSVAVSFIKKEEIESPRNGASLSNIMQDTFFMFMMYST